MIAIDLGSNTIRIVKWDCKENKKIDEFEKIIKTADGLVESGEINKEAIKRIIEAINEAKEKIDFNDKIVAVATEALRRAKNKDEVIKEIKEKTGIEFKIISPYEEAKYTALAVENCLNRCGYDARNFFLVDIGGGSTELILKHKNEIVSKSYKVGIVTLTQKYKTTDAIKIAAKKEVVKFKEFIDFVFNAYKKPKIFTASSGTPTTIAALKYGMNYKTYNPQKINGTIITPDDLDFWMDKLLKMEMKKREELVGVGRGDLIVSGIMIFKEIFRITKYNECIVCDDGVREGVAISECKKK
ncbi:phosphatase [Caminibacter mediatlanticus]|uniref:POSSIBLE PHOSPHATASE n=1 Tax=Caminibacter mediatlanticus TB-2 TaxID=391592 RepID=A0AAI9F212_9BACT|nr:phosphatase [Caminibacter mediatlanticus]EDM24272.1 POSSIBLE PHOSPHATASE [Caminibacter mediatlanticus TB-2]